MLVPLALAASPVCGSADATTYLTWCAGKGTDEDGVSIAGSALPLAPGCATVVLPIDADQILAAVRAPRRRPGAPDPETVTLTGERLDDTFRVSTVAMIPVSNSPAPPYLVPGSDLRAIASIHTFGPPGRAVMENDGNQTVLNCASGADPAGLALTTVRMPPIPQMSLRVLHSADESFRLAVSDTSQALRLIAEFEPVDSTSEGVVPMTGLPADTPLEFEVLCPPAGGHLQLDEIVLEAKPELRTDRAAWISDAQFWLSDPARIFARAQAWGLTRLYIAVPMGEGGGLSDPQALAGFLAEANGRGIDVWALLRDNVGGGDAITRAGAALADYNQAVPPTAQLKGVAIEYAPDRRWAYSPDPDATAAALLDRLSGLRPALGMPLVAIVPNWFPTDAAIADRYVTTLDGMIVLTDRTEPDVIRRAVTRFLAWGARHGRPVAVAFETGALTAEEQGHFARAETGELWLIPVGGERLLLLLRQAAAQLPGLGFALQESVALPAEGRSFFGHRATLREALDPLGHVFGAWPSFAGFAFRDLFAEKR